MTQFRPSWKGLGIFPYNMMPGEEIALEDVTDALLALEHGKAKGRFVIKF